MANEVYEPWVRMRSSLLSNPKVIAIATFLNGSRDFKNWWVGQCHYSVRDVVTECVTPVALRLLVIGALHQVWGAANEHSRGGLLENFCIGELDDVAGVDGFGEAMEAVGWAVQQEEPLAVRLPNFEEYNVPRRDRVAMTAAQRQQKRRDKLRAEREREAARGETDFVASRNVTNVTTEKEKEKEKEKDTKNPPTPRGGVPEGFPEFWAAYPRKTGKAAAEKAWRKIGPDATLRAAIAGALARQSAWEEWRRGFIPHPATWLNGRRWEDEEPPRRNGQAATHDELLDFFRKKE